MRRIIEPPPSSRCTGCGGQLRLKRIASVNAALGQASHVFVCNGCGAERCIASRHDAYASAPWHGQSQPAG